MTVREIASHANFLTGGTLSLAACVVHINESVAILTGRFLTAPKTSETTIITDNNDMIKNLPDDFLRVRHLSILSNNVNLRVDSKYYNVDDAKITLPMEGSYTLKYSANPSLIDESDVDSEPGIRDEFHSALIRYTAAQLSNNQDRNYHTLKFEELSMEAHRRLLRGGQ